MPSKLKISVTGQPIKGETITLSDNYKGQSVYGVFQSNRFSNNEIAIGSSLPQTARNILNSFSTDYFGKGLNITFESDTVIIFEADEENVFENAFVPVSIDPSPELSSPPGPVPTFEITSITHEEADNPCLKFKVRIQTNEITQSFDISGVTTIINSDNFTLELPRSQGIYLIGCMSVSGEYVTDIFSSIITFNIIVEQNQTYNGVTINVIPLFQNTGAITPVFSWSLDGVNFGNSGVWTGLLEGEYTAYIKDDYGCIKSLDFEIIESESVYDRPEPYIFVSLLNSIRYARRDGERRNFQNLESYEDPTDLNYEDFNHLFEQNDIIKTQFDSSYLNHKVILYKCGENILELPITQKSKNINRNDYRWGWTFKTDTGKLGVYYSDDLNILDPETGDIIGLSNLEGTLLAGQNAGAFVNVETYGWIQINSIKIDPLKGFYMAFDIPYINDGTTHRIREIRFLHTVENFEVFEFAINWSGFNDVYQIGIHSWNDEGDTVSNMRYLSEPIYIGETNFNKYHVIRWRNSVNNQIKWETKIEGKAILPYYIPPTFQPKGSSDIHMTDTSAVMLESDAKEIHIFHFRLLPLAVARQIAMIVSNDFLEIDGLMYIKEDVPDIEAQKGSNLYSVEVPLLLATSYNSNSRDNGASFEQDSGGGYLQNGNGYLKL